MTALPVAVWHVVIDDPHNLVPSWHPREAHYTDAAEARAHAEQAGHLGGDARLYRSETAWAEVAR